MTRARPTLAAFTLLAALLGAASCGSVVAAGKWVATPALQVADADANEDCRDQPHRVAPLPTSRRVRIGTWNMHYLGPSEQTPVERRDPGALAEYIRQSGASALALQEIGVQGDARNPRSRTLDAVLDELRARGGGDWTYLLYGNVEKDTSQFVGLAWDRTVFTQAGKPLPLHLQGDTPAGIVPLVPLPVSTDVPMRQPFAVQLRTVTGSDFVFVPVHLAARAELFFFEDAVSHRQAEAEALSRALDRIVAHFHDRDVIVLGDFNVELATEDVADALVERGWRDLNCAGLATYRGLLALDRFFVPADQPEFAVDRSFARVAPPDAATWSDFVERYSDHMLVVADVLVGLDDD